MDKGEGEKEPKFYIIKVAQLPKCQTTNNHKRKFSCCLNITHKL